MPTISQAMDRLQLRRARYPSWNRASRRNAARAPIGEGRGKRLTFPIEHYHHLGGANHFDLLNHPAIFEQMRRCLASQRALPASGRC